MLTVDYNGQMPWDCTTNTTDPEVAYRLNIYISGGKKVLVK